MRFHPGLAVAERFRIWLRDQEALDSAFSRLVWIRVVRIFGLVVYARRKQRLDRNRETAEATTHWGNFAPRPRTSGIRTSVRQSAAFAGRVFRVAGA